MIMRLRARNVHPPGGQRRPPQSLLLCDRRNRAHAGADKPYKREVGMIDVDDVADVGLIGSRVCSIDRTGVFRRIDVLVADKA